jgi:hypothetical protein
MPALLEFGQKRPRPRWGLFHASCTLINHGNVIVELSVNVTVIE